MRRGSYETGGNERKREKRGDEDKVRRKERKKRINIRKKSGEKMEKK